MQRFTFIDLFCGCGGFILGMERAGFECLAALDFNPEALAVFRKNFSHVPQVLDQDLTQFPPTELACRLGVDRVDVIVGGASLLGIQHRMLSGQEFNSELQLNHVDDYQRLM